MTNIEFRPEDFSLLDDFPLCWRWTEERANVLPAHDLARIHPLTAARAAEIAPRAAYLCDQRRDLPFWLNADAAPAKVEARLRALHIAPKERVVVSWNEGTAVVTDWDFFCHYWDDFCYPSSDDVTVLAVNGQWVLCYDHCEVFRLDHPDHAL
jgi:hypothetical protein